MISMDSCSMRIRERSMRHMPLMICRSLRQGVYDIIRRCTRSLENYEQALHLVARFMKIKEDIERIQKLTEGDRVTENSLGEIRRISRGILEEL